MVTIPIEQIRVGLRVPGLNPELDSSQRVEPDPDPAIWRRLELRAPKTDGSWADVVLLRPLSWLQEQQAEVGGHVWISVPECSIDGHATVLAIGPCPPIPPGPGRVVTGTFRHASARVLDLQIDGLAEPIGATANHPFWSEDRQEFVRADGLEIGERLRTLHGAARLIDTVPRSGTEPVYNLEVQTEHVYHVTDAGVLVHNGRVCPTPSRPGPKTDPNAPHNAKIREIAERLKSEGNTVLSGGGGKERLIPTPGGKKGGRRPDIEYETPSGEARGINVGKTRKDGTPVKREVDALEDLNGPGGLPTDFEPYD